MIKDGKLTSVRYVPARIIGGPIKPTLIVIHDTAGRIEDGSSVKWFQDKKCETSAHIVIELDGTVTQMVPFNRKAAHAGQSAWNGKTFCNSFSIGIEIVNPGKLDHNGKAWFDQCFQGKQCKTDEHGVGLWMPYTQEQIDSVIEVCRAICAEYADVNEIVGHWQISPGRKVDPSPLFPWDYVRDEVFNSTEDVPVEPVKPVPTSMVTSKEGAAQVVNGTAGGGIALDGAWDAASKTLEVAAKAGRAPSTWEIGSSIFASTQVKIGVGIAIAAALSWFWRAQKRWSGN